MNINNVTMKHHETSAAPTASLWMNGDVLKVRLQSPGNRSGRATHGSQGAHCSAVLHKCGMRMAAWIVALIL